ncbi:MAG: DUF1553 domain-containing protein, partial [Planctomyces sp.]
IEQGAEFEKHWAFIPLSPSEIPELNQKSPIDSFVLKTLTSRGLSFQPEADRYTLIRRLSFDLRGLPPTPEEISQFVNDPASDAYEQLVDRLLASEDFGERMAADWLDVARYADSYGFQVDRERDVWAWRDWVVNAFNRNLPFDQFITWQIAGDLLPDATDEQILATAFCRLHQQETEGGSVEEEYRVEYVSDRVQTFATAFLGITFECARCHDHKFDPITQKEYYQLFSMFQNIDEAGLYSYFTLSPPTPTLSMPDDSTRQKLADLKIRIRKSEEDLEILRTSGADRFQEWLSGAKENATKESGTSPEEQGGGAFSGEIARFQFDSANEGKLLNDKAADQPAILKGDNRLVSGWQGSAVEFSGDDPVGLAVGNFRREEPFSVSLWMKTPDLKDRAVVFHRSQAWTDAASRGYELLIDQGRLRWSLIHFWPGNAASVVSKNQLPINEWTHVAVTSDGSSRADGLKIYINGSIADISVLRDNLSREITGGGGDNITLGERMRDRGFTRGLIDDFRVFRRELSPLEARTAFSPEKGSPLHASKASELAAADRELLFRHYLVTVDKDYQSALNSLQQLRSEHNKLEDSVREIMVMRELPVPKPAYVLFRGEYGARREEVQAGAPAAILPFPDDAPRNRLGLARWLTDRSHPLTARVTVNRIWQSLWGRGLVRSSEDFGSQGSRPMYPEVLDWLSLTFIDSGWNTKQLLRTIVSSRAYRQQSTGARVMMEEDPENELLARGPSFRLSAECIRDNALAVSGLLKRGLGGPPVNPYEMSEAFKPQAPSDPSDVYRRSLYTSWRRTSPPPAMLAFDAPRRAVCSAKRERTNSPLQALILMNGVQYIEAARVLGENLHTEFQGDIDRIIDSAFLKCLSRRPDSRELSICRQLYQEQLSHYEADPAAAEELRKIGNKASLTEIPAPKAAAVTILMQTLLNHDECVVKR